MIFVAVVYNYQQIKICKLSNKTFPFPEINPEISDQRSCGCAKIQKLELVWICCLPTNAAENK